MSEIWTNIRKVKAMVESGVDPDRYRFVCAPGQAVLLEKALVEFGVNENDIDLYLINESAAVDAGQILVMDLKIIEDNFQRAMQSWRPMWAR